MTAIKVDTAPTTEGATFRSLGISEKVLAILDKNGFVTPTPIQHKVIPLGVQGKDIVGIAQTGTGKTLGFGIPMIERLLAGTGLGLILLPTRELALQVDETMRKIGNPLGLYTAVLIGGEPIGKQIRDLKRKPDVVIATPGRLIDHLKQGTIRLDGISVLVLDEADHMFDIGFMPQIKEIIKKVPKERQTMLFSATMPDAISKLALEHLALPLKIEVAPQGTASEKVEQEIIIVERHAKFGLLVKTLGDYKGPVLVFTRTKHGAKEIAESLRDTGFTASEIHSNRSLGQRREALSGFKTGKYQVLVATDIAARGIDVKEIELVVNYDLPEQSEDYVHRIGRTGRAGKTGKAISFAAPFEARDIFEIERLIRKTLPKRSHEGAAMGSGSSRPQRGGYRGGGRRGGGSGRPERRGGFGGSRGGPGASRGRSGGFSRGNSFGRREEARPPKTSFSGNTRKIFRKIG